jgi:hypothetical protein
MLVHMLACAAYGAALCLLGYTPTTPGYWLLFGLTLVVTYTQPDLYG